MSDTETRVVFLTTSGAVGGAETSLLTLAGALRAQAPSSDLAVIAPASGPLTDRCRAMGIDVAVIPYPPSIASLGERGAGSGPAARLRTMGRVSLAAAALPPYLRKLRREIRRRRATVVHTNGVKAHIVGTLAAPRDARLVWHIHEYVRSRPWSARLLRGLASRAWAIVANSDSVADDVRAAWGTALPVRRIYNAVDLTVFHPDGRALDLASAAGLPDAGDRIRIGLVATFGRWKGHDVFVEAISRLTPRDRVRAYVIGGPVYETAGSQYSRTELQRAVAARGLSGTIGFTGHVDDVAAAMRALDIVVHASTQPEPFGMVIAEAMAAGRPVVAARAGGAKELFDDGATGVGHAMGDAGDLAACLQALLDDPARRRALGCAARRAAAARFSAARMAAEFAQVYSG